MSRVRLSRSFAAYGSRLEAVKQLAAEQKSGREIATELGVSRHTINRYCRSLGINLSLRGESLKEAVRQLLLVHKTSHEIALELGVRYGTVSRLSRKLAIKPARRNRRIKGYMETKVTAVIAELFHDWWASDVAISGRHGCTREMIGQVRAWMLLRGVVPTQAATEPLVTAISAQENNELGSQI